MSSRHDTPINLQTLEERLTQLAEVETDRIKKITEMHEKEWNAGREPEYETTEEDRARSLDYAIRFVLGEKDQLIIHNILFLDRSPDQVLLKHLKGMVSGFEYAFIKCDSVEAANAEIAVKKFRVAIADRLPEEGEDPFLKKFKSGNPLASAILLYAKGDETGDLSYLDSMIKTPIASEEEEKIVDQINLAYIRADVREKKKRLENEMFSIVLQQPDLNFLEYEDILKKSIADLEKDLVPHFDFSKAVPKEVYTATPIYPGAASARIFGDLDKAMEHGGKGGHSIIYVDDLTTLKLIDVRMLRHAKGIIFNRMSRISHSVIALKNAGIPMIQAENTSRNKREFRFGDFTVKEKTPISFDGLTGKIYAGSQKVAPSPIVNRLLAGDAERSMGEEDPERQVVDDFDKLMRRCDEVLKGRIRIMINAHLMETVDDAEQYGVTDIGLARSEDVLRENGANVEKYCAYMLSIVAEKKKPKQRARKAFKNMQADAFYEILKFQRGRRTQIRLLDAPFKEFFDDATIDRVAEKTTGIEKDDAKKLKEIVNDPIKQKGDRGVVIAIRYPDVYEAQLEAVFDAYSRLKEEEPDAEIDLKIYIPYVFNIDQVRRVQGMAESLNKHKYDGKIDYKLAVTLETMGGVFNTDKMMEMGIKDFTFGTNDLIQMIESSQAEREVDDYSVDAQGKYHMDSSALAETIMISLRKMAAWSNSTEQPRDQYEVGVAGEINEVKLDHLRDVMPCVDSVSASRPLQIPIIKLKLAQMCVERYRDMAVGTGSNGSD